MTASVRALSLSLAALVALTLLAGCGSEPAPKLTQEQLSAGVIGDEHPVNQEQAQTQGCQCHLGGQ